MSVAQVRDVAALAGVSAGTVSNALNHPDKVSPATLKRIQDAIEELGFVRNEAAARLRRGVNRTVGMLVLDVGNPFFTEVARGVEDRVTGENRPLVLGNSSQSAAREIVYLDAFEEQRLAGLLVTPVTEDLDRLRRIRDRGTAVVLVDRMSKTKDFSSVAVDDRLGGRLAAEHLLSLGRRRIAFIGGPRSISQVAIRLKAAQAAVKRFGAGEIVYLETDAMNAASGRQCVEAILDLPRSRRPDSIFAANDLIGLGALQALTLSGLRVPDDMAIVGYDDIEFAASAAIPLTSVRQPAHLIGETAASILLETIENPGTAMHQVTLRPELVQRESTGC
jgi:LacI family transcriptional regulator